MTEVAPYGPLADAAGLAADDLRQIGMIEGDNRYAATAGHVGRTPGRMERITRFDQVWLEGSNQIRPSRRIERQTVVESGGHGESAQRTYPTSVHSVLG